MNHIDQGEPDDGCPYQFLIEGLDDYEGTAAFAELLIPWLEAHPGEAAWLASLRERGRSSVPAVTAEELWRLYALSRLCETLVLRLQRSNREADASGNAWSMQQVEDFFARIGIDALRPDAFAPFHHEIVEMIPSAVPHQAPCILAWHWPCFMLGPLLIMRAGVTVSAGTRVLVPGIADASTLYWTYRRENRPSQDLAHGWGHNSSWRTAFRRDYDLGGEHHFNVDAPRDLADVDPGALNEYGLTKTERLELLIHRSFVTSATEHTDLFPYNDRFSMRFPPVPPTTRTSFWKRLLG